MSAPEKGVTKQQIEQLLRNGRDTFSDEIPGREVYSPELYKCRTGYFASVKWNLQLGLAHHVIDESLRPAIEEFVQSVTSESFGQRPKTPEDIRRVNRIVALVLGEESLDAPQNVQ